MHEHDHDHDDHSHLSETELRVRALESILVEKGYVDPKALDVLIETYETKVGPHNGARVVARAWADANYKTRLLKDATAAIAEFGFTGRQGEHMVAVENTGKVHNLVVCTLCSCYPWTVLGLPPVWYKSAPYRSRAVSEPRSVLADFGVTLPGDKEIKVWDSTAEIRYLVVPQRPAGTDGWNEERLAALVTRDSMIGTGLPKSPGRTPMNGAHDMGGTMGFGPVVAREKRAGLPCAVGAPRVRDHARGGRRPLEPGPIAFGARADARRSSIWQRPITRSGSRGSRSCWPSAASSRRTKSPPARFSMRRRIRRSSSPRIGWLWRFPKADRRRVPASAPQRFQVGDRVRARNMHPAGHTRLPRYVRGHAGTITHVHGVHVLPDANSTGRGEDPQWLYTVRFTARELWGEAADPTCSVSVDAWESYLEPQ